MGKLDFDGVAALALDRAAELLPRWMGGKRAGHNWTAESTSTGGIGDSWSINLQSGIWAHFGGSERGSDMTSLFAALQGISQGAAHAAIEAQLGLNGSERPLPAPRRARVQAPEEPLQDPIPANTPHLPDHKDHGAPTVVYRYGDQFWIARYDLSATEKTFSQYTWRHGKWWGRGPSNARQIYNLADLQSKPSDAVVLIVEGEKCVEAARDILSSYVITTWACGGNAISHSDWSVLEGRKVILWPDADDAGRAAMAALAQILAPIASNVRVITPDRDDGWDIANAIAEGWDAARIASYAKDRITIAEPAPVSDSIAQPTPGAADRGAAETSGDPLPTQEVSGSATRAPATLIIARPAATPRSKPVVIAAKSDDATLIAWENLHLEKNKYGPHATLANASLILRFHEEFAGKIWFDTFKGRIQHTLRGETPANWTDADLRSVTVKVQQMLQLPKFTSALMQEAVLNCGDNDQRNSVTDWLDALKWDGTHRLDNWLSDYLGVEYTDYTKAVARNWLIAMVARAKTPGCKMDNMVVLEGTQGRGKSSFLATLGGEWYASIGTAFGDKEFLQTIVGKWLIEIPDMTGFSRRDHSLIISTLSTTQDTYRQSYGRNAADYPRQCVFAATSETDNYLKDIRGRRRYWPLRCTEINLSGLKEQRENLFAEAATALRNGESWFNMPDSADKEQLDRAYEDVWNDRVLSYANAIRNDEARGHGKHYVYVDDVLENCCKVKPDAQDDGDEGRIRRILGADGWMPTRDNKARRCWRKPIRNGE